MSAVKFPILATPSKGFREFQLKAETLHSVQMALDHIIQENDNNPLTRVQISAHFEERNKVEEVKYLEESIGATHGTQ